MLPGIVQQATGNQVVSNYSSSKETEKVVNKAPTEVKGEKDKKSIFSIENKADIMAKIESKDVITAKGATSTETVIAKPDVKGDTDVKPNSTALPVKAYKKGKWTPEEDKALLLGVKMSRDRGEKVNFRTIAAAFLDRSSKQAKERWENSLNPDIRKGRWSRKEELQLIDLMVEYGQNWAAIQSKMPTRALHCVKAKGRLLLGERLSLLNMKSEETHNREWSQNEIYELVTLHGLYGYDLKRISLLLGTGRSIAQLDRQLLSFCNCKQCRTRATEMQVTSDVDSLKSSWTKVRAKAIKDNMLKEAAPVRTFRDAVDAHKDQQNSHQSTKLKRKQSDYQRTSVQKEQTNKTLKRPRNATYVSTSPQYTLAPQQSMRVPGQTVFMVAPGQAGTAQANVCHIQKQDPNLYQQPQQYFMRSPPPMSQVQPQVIYMTHPQAMTANQVQPNMQHMQQQTLIPGAGFRQVMINNQVPPQFSYPTRPGTPPSNYVTYTPR